MHNNFFLASNSLFYLNKELALHAQTGNLISAQRIFNSIKSPNIISWNTLLSAFSRSPGTLQHALNLFDQIPQPNLISFNTLLSCYLINSDLPGASRLFSSIPDKDTSSWNTMVSGLARHGFIDDARELFTNIPKKNSISWNAIVSGFVQVGDLDSAEEYFIRAPDRNDVVLRTTMITGFMSGGKMERAWEMFDGMLVRNSVSWNAMIAGLVANGCAVDALKLFRRMIGDDEVEPNVSTLSSALLGCSNLPALESGRQIHQFVMKLPMSINGSVGTSLLSMYCKCGDLFTACKMFDEIPVKDIVSWNSMISGYAQHGHGKKAINLFNKMKDEGLKPNRITFVTLLSACIHSGLVDLGMKYFDSMSDYGVKPCADHYSCMVDLLCRAGLLEKAANLIQSMPFEPHASAFGTLLNASRIHKNSFFAEFAARKLVELEPRNAGAYVQLANVYASINKWNDVARVRKWMKENHAVKMPGYSWIELKGVLHVFRSGDRLHPHLDLIHNKLNDLWIRIKDVGYVPDFNFALHNVSDMQKEMMLMMHSEKLAIAFALMNTTQGNPVRVFKNIRICGDCHNAIKYFSMIEQREIILRDNTRFHHFANGRCTCGDYW